MGWYTLCPWRLQYQMDQASMNDSVMTDHILKGGKDNRCFSYCKRRVAVAMSHIVCCVVSVLCQQSFNKVQLHSYKTCVRC